MDLNLFLSSYKISIDCWKVCFSFGKKMFSNRFKILTLILFEIILFKISNGCRCDARVGFGNICGYRLSISRSDGCQPNALYFCDKNLPNGSAVETKNCLNFNQFCIYGWIKTEDIQTDICVNYFNLNQNSTAIDFQSSFITPRA